MRIRIPFFLAVLGSAAALPAAGRAADLPEVAPSPPVHELAAGSPVSWSGFYGGFSLGYGVGSEDEVDAQVFPDTVPLVLGTLAPQGAIGGLQAGYNWQKGNLVFGVETDLQLAGVSDSGDATAFGVALGTNSVDVDWYGTLRVRMGYAAGRNLFYATGGLAYGGLDGAVVASGPAGLNTVMQTSGDATLGYAVGGGVEHAVTSRISLRGEYQFVHLGTDATGTVFDAAGADTGVVGTSKVKANLHTFKVGLNFRF